MNKEIEKLLFNPIRLKTISFLMTVETCNFKVLLEITDSTKGNLSIQLKKLNEAGLIKIEKYFQKVILQQIILLLTKVKNHLKNFIINCYHTKKVK